MKKIYSLIIGLIFAGTLGLNAQETPAAGKKQATAPQLKWYSLNESSKKDLVRGLNVIGEDDKYIYVYYPADSKTNLEADSKTNKLFRYSKETGNSEELKFNLNGYFMPESKNVEFMMMLNNQVYVFYSERSKTKNKYTLKGIAIDKESFKKTSDEKTVLEFSYKDDNGLNKTASFSGTVSPDKSKILLTYHFKSFKNEIIRYGFHVIDSKFNLIWKSENGLPSLLNNGWFQTKEYVVNNTGDVYLSGNIYDNSTKAGENPHTNGSVVVLFSAKTKSSEVLNVNLSNGKYVKSSNIGISENNELICAGLYSQNKMKSALGTFSMIVDTAAKASNLVIVAFSPQFLTKGLSSKDSSKLMDKVAKNKDFEDWDYASQNILFKKDGTHQLIVEKYKTKGKVKRETNDYQVKRFKHTFGDILVVNFAGSDSVEWMQKIVKNQKVKNDDKQTSSYGLGYGENDEMYFFYNQMGNSPSKSELMLTTLADSNGSQETIQLHNTKDNKIRVRPSELTAVTNNTVILFGQKGSSKSTILKITDLPVIEKPVVIPPVLPQSYLCIVLDSLSKTPLKATLTFQREGTNEIYTVISGDTSSKVDLYTDSIYNVIYHVDSFPKALATVIPALNQSEITLQYYLPLSLTGNVKNKRGNPAKGSQITLKDNLGKSFNAIADSLGNYQLTGLQMGKNYKIEVKSNGYETTYDSLSLPSNFNELKPSYSKDLVLIPVKKFIMPDNILFDVGKSDLKQEAMMELDNLAFMLLENPEIKVEVGAHTDSRGTAALNNKLSEQRAKSVVDYLVSQGIENQRITAKGYGFTRLINKCKKGVKCTETEHAANRRVEFTFSSVD